MNYTICETEVPTEPVWTNDIIYMDKRYTWYSVTMVISWFSCFDYYIGLSMSMNAKLFIETPLFSVIGSQA